MPGFFYYLPCSGVDLEAVRALGLGYAFEAPQITRRQVSPGPDDGPGVIFARAAACMAQDLEYAPALQTWAKAVKGDYWVGYLNGAIPHPEVLARPARITHCAMRLGDGNTWELPTAILANGESPLPKVRRLCEDGSIQRIVQKQYHSLYLAADRVRSAIRDREPMDDAAEWEICVQALQTNYYVGPDEISALGLFTDEAMAAIFMVLVDRMNWPDVSALGAQGGT